MGEKTRNYWDKPHRPPNHSLFITDYFCIIYNLRERFILQSSPPTFSIVQSAHVELNHCVVALIPQLVEVKPHLRAEYIERLEGLIFETSFLCCGGGGV